MQGRWFGVALLGISACCGDEVETGAGDGGGTTILCASDPFVCSGGQTCESDDSGGPYTCKPSGNGSKGDACVPAPKPPCSDGLICGGIPLSGESTCLALCTPGDPAHGCPPGEECIDSDPNVCFATGAGGQGGGT